MPKYHSKAADLVLWINPLPGEKEEKTLPDGRVIHADAQPYKLKFVGHYLDTDQLPEFIRKKAELRIQQDAEYGLTIRAQSQMVQDELDREARLDARERELADREAALKRREDEVAKHEASPAVQAAMAGEKNAAAAGGATPAPPAPQPSDIQHGAGPVVGDQGQVQSPLLDTSDRDQKPADADKYAEMDFQALRDECKARELSAGGSADEMRYRLREADGKNA